MGRRGHCVHGVRVAKPAASRVCRRSLRRWVNGCLPSFAVQFGIGGGGFLQIAAEGFFDGGQAAAGAFDLFFKGFFVARQLVFADKGAVADGLCEVVVQGVGR